jgi:hypothetical protein
MLPIDIDTLSIEQDGAPDSGRSDILEPDHGEVELPLRMRCVNSMPEIPDNQRIDQFVSHPNEK